MKPRILALTIAGAFSLAVSASATPSSGVTGSGKVVSSSANILVKAGTNKLSLSFGSTKAPINILNVHQTFAPGGFSGWHTHSGPGLVVVEHGTITIEEHEGCFVDYPEGAVLFEGGPSRIHNALNRTPTAVILDAYFLLPTFDPPGANSRIDADIQPGPCDVPGEDEGN